MKRIVFVSQPASVEEALVRKLHEFPCKQLKNYILKEALLVRNYGITWYNDLLKLSKRLPF